MNAPLAAAVMARAASPFDLADETCYARWRAWKLAVRAKAVDELRVDIADPRCLTPGEHDALLDRIARNNFALYRSDCVQEDTAIARDLGGQLGLRRLDANWLAGEDGVSSITVSDAHDGRGGFIPYTDRAIGWHTDGYYHPEERRIHAMILHCVRPASSGGDNALLDPELAYIALRDASPDFVRALMQPGAMTIPARADDEGVARAPQTGPVISFTPSGCLHFRYTARKRSIEWKADAATRAAVACLEALLAGGSPWVHRCRLDAGMGVVGHNVLHDRIAFVDDPARPRLLYRARFLDRIAVPQEAAWRNG
jgi:alpha-ketoglutarate-dependent taurine dioxygenase